MKDYGLPVSAALHVLVLAGALVALPSIEPFAPTEESLPVEVLTPEQFAAITKGEKTAKPAEKPQVRADKVAEAKLDDDPAEKVKRESVATPPPPQPKAPDPVPEPPKPVAKPDPAPEPPKPEPVKLPDLPKPPAPPKPEPVKAEAKPIPKEQSKALDDLALKALQEDKPKDEAKPDKPDPKPVAKPVEKPAQKVADVKPAEKPPVEKPPAAKASTASDQDERPFDPSKIAALLSKEAPARAARQDTQASQTSSLGSSRGNAPKLSLSQRTALIGAIMQHVSPCWSPPSFAVDAKDLSVLIEVDLNPDGTLATDPQVTKYPASKSGSAAASAAVRALKRCVTEQTPLKLPPDLYASWKGIEVNFDPKLMAGG